jgi:hypothetical protein
MAGTFLKNFLWPTIVGLGGAVVTAIASNASTILDDGLQAGDWGKIGGIVLSAIIAFVATTMNRYAGSEEPWVQPKKEG